MRVHIALKTPNGTLHDQIFDGVEAHINARNVLQIFYVYSKRLLAEFPPRDLRLMAICGTPLSANGEPSGAAAPPSRRIETMPT